MTPFAPFTIDVPGTPEPHRRHRSVTRGGRVVTYDDPLNTNYSDRIRWAWRDAGSPTINAGLFILSVTACFPRPKSHLRRSDGGLTAAGLRTPNPSRIDVDNILKAPMDALNGLAWADDRQCIAASVRKQWADMAPCLHIKCVPYPSGGAQ